MQKYASRYRWGVLENYFSCLDEPQRQVQEMNTQLWHKRLQIWINLKLDNSLETELNLNKYSRTISAELKEALEQTILPKVSDKTKNYLFSTLWTAISKSKNIMIGDLCIVGEPNENGEIEIGYGTYREFQGKGFMTEIVGGIIKWANSQQKVVAIVASTEKINIASSKVLEKNNFFIISETEVLINWKLIL